MNSDRERLILPWVVVLSALLFALPLFSRQGEDGKQKSSAPFGLAGGARCTEFIGGIHDEPGFGEGEANPDQPDVLAILRNKTKSAERTAEGAKEIRHFAVGRDCRVMLKSREPPGVHRRII